jgi:hypothetical protein
MKNGYKTKNVSLPFIIGYIEKTYDYIGLNFSLLNIFSSFKTSGLETFFRLKDNLLEEVQIQSLDFF